MVHMFECSVSYRESRISMKKDLILKWFSLEQGKLLAEKVIASLDDYRHHWSILLCIFDLQLFSLYLLLICANGLLMIFNFCYQFTIQLWYILLSLHWLVFLARLGKIKRFISFGLSVCMQIWKGGDDESYIVHH